MKKRFLATVLAAALSLSAVLTGCTTGGTASVNDGGGSSGTVSAGNEAWDSSKKDKIVLSVINNYYTAGWKQMAEEYMKLHPETEVVVDVVADNDAYTQKVTTWLTSDDLTQAADIIHINFASGPMGGYNVMYEKDMIYDFNDMMDETNPYNGGKKVSEAFNKDDLPLLQDLGKQYALPFDFVGVAIMYNKDILDKNNIAVPTTNEELVAACTKLKEAGFEAPIAATSEASWYLSSIADAALRAKEQDFLVQAGDGLYDAATMSVNDGFTFNENDWTCDRYTIMSGERIGTNFARSLSSSRPIMPLLPPQKYSPASSWEIPHSCCQAPGMWGFLTAIFRRWAKTALNGEPWPSRSMRTLRPGSSLNCARCTVSATLWALSRPMVTATISSV